jgi:hypothetical protein
MDYAEAVATFRADVPHLKRRGIDWMPGVMPRSYVADEWREDFNLAMDAQPTLFTDPTSAVPAILTTMIDPQVYEILFAPSRAAEILGEMKRGDWLMDVTLFPVVEATGEVSSYGDFNNNGRAGVNTAWPQRQSYLFQVIKQYGEREMERAGLAKINWVSEIDKAAALTMTKFLNYTYFFGVGGLQNYGMVNDPNLSAPITPAIKAAGGTAWIIAGRINATANEIYADFEAIYYQLVVQTRGLVTRDSPLILALDPGVDVALTATNSFNVNVADLIKKNFPNVKVITAPQYGVSSATNPQGIAAGNLVQLIAPAVENQKTGYAAFNEKMRTHPVIRHMSSFRQKVTGGTWGMVLRFPAGVAAMIGV